MIMALSHITLVVKDLEKAAVFFEQIFDAREVYSSGDRTFSLAREKFFLIGELWICIMEGEPLPKRSYNHIAFKIDKSEIDDYLNKIRKTGVEIKPERPRVQGEGQSIYFYDFDNHLFELHTGTLEERLACYEKTDNRT